MIKKILFSSLTLLCLSACGQEAAIPDAPAEILAETETVDTPDIAPAQNLETSNRLAAAGAMSNELASRGVREIGWEELMPEGEEERIAEMYQEQMAALYSSAPIAEGSAGDMMVQIGTYNTVDELNEVRVRIPGYTVPFEYGSDAEIGEFLLVPYYGACIHSPPPPPNQTIYVSTETPIKLRDLAQAVWIEGTMQTETQVTDLANAAYTIKLENISVYDY